MNYMRQILALKLAYTELDTAQSKLVNALLMHTENGLKKYIFLASLVFLSWVELSAF